LSSCHLFASAYRTVYRFEPGQGQLDEGLGDHLGDPEQAPRPAHRHNWAPEVSVVANSAACRRPRRTVPAAPDAVSPRLRRLQSSLAINGVWQQRHLVALCALHLWTQGLGTEAVAARLRQLDSRCRWNSEDAAGAIRAVIRQLDGEKALARVEPGHRARADTPAVAANAGSLAPWA